LVSAYCIPCLPNEHPKMWLGKTIHQKPKAPTIKHANNCASTITLKVCICQVTMVPHPGFGCIVCLDFGLEPTIEQYMLTISSFPKCSCPYFKEMATKSLGKQGQWANFKHLYFVFTVICNLQLAIDAFIHAPSFSFNEVKKILLSGILNHLALN